MLLSSYGTKLIEAGCDEAGRGCLAGPVFAASVILPPDYKNELLDDSKKLPKKKRLALRQIIEKEAVAWAVVSLDNNYIDTHNILNASIDAMRQAVNKLSVKPEFLLIDGNRFKPCDNIPHICIVKGDSKYLSIAAASILAKTYRDDYMNALSAQYPEYGWDKNKGYPTAAHIEAYRKHGATAYHRKTFKINEQLKFKFAN